MKRIFLLIMLILTVMLSAQSRRIALLNLDNVNGDPQYDYLEGMIRGVLLFDLGSQRDIQLVVRSELNAVLAEQQLALSGMMQDDALQVGELLSADYLISGEYIFLGDDVMVNLSLIDVETGTSTAYRSRGNRENFIHGMAEELILDITGREVALQGNDGDRSIISLRDEAPGTLVFYTYIQRGELYLDGEFVGYTTGDRQVPFIMEDIPAGTHTIGLKLWEFGVVDKPEYIFRPYEEEITIEPGKRLILRPDIRLYGDFIRDDITLIDEYWHYHTFPEDGIQPIEVEYSFVDRNGQEQMGFITGTITDMNDGKNIDLIFETEGHDFPLTLHAQGRSYQEVEETFGPVDIELQYSSSRFTLRVRRNDIWFGMHLEQ